VQSVELPSTESSELARLCAHFDDGLHALAQPLTVLRSVVLTAINSEISAQDRQRYLEMSVEQVEGACQLFQTLRELVFAWQNAAGRELIDLSQMLASVEEVQSEVLQQSGVKLAVQAPDLLPPTLGDKDRTLQALFGLLQITASVSAPRDLIELQVTPIAGEIQLTLQNRRVSGNYLKSAARLTLALAETNIRSQRGVFQFVENPLCVIFTLPTREIDALESDIEHSRSNSIR
jgi:hypothetical protein